MSRGDVLNAGLPAQRAGKNGEEYAHVVRVRSVNATPCPDALLNLRFVEPKRIGGDQWRLQMPADSNS